MFEGKWEDIDFVGGHIAVDFVNTAGGATKARDVERLVDYVSAVSWGCATALLTEDEGRLLSAMAATDAGRAHAALESLRAFREALHAILLAQQAVLKWPPPQHATVESAIKTALRDAYLVDDRGHYQWQLTSEQCGVELILKRLALKAESLLRSDDLLHLKNCERCSWLFIDRGRGRPRRWCSMAICGSRAKSARYYLRHRSTKD